MDMYFYALSRGDYSDYVSLVVYHETQYSKKEFTHFYNQAIESLGGEVRYNHEVAEQLIHLFNFKLMETEIEIHVGSRDHRPIDFEYEERFKQLRAEEEAFMKRYRGEST